MRNFGFWQRWLTTVCWGMAVFGLGLALAGQFPAAERWIGRWVDPTLWGPTETTSAASSYARWMYGVLGATVAGWGVCMAVLTRHAFARREHWAWKCLGAGATVWFVTDTGISAAHGVWVNVAFNTAAALLMALPLLATRSAFR